MGVLSKPESIGRDRLNAITFRCWVLVVLYPSAMPVWGRVGGLLRGYGACRGSGVAVGENVISPGSGG